MMTMMMVNIFQAKARLSEIIDAAARGERVLICNRNRPVAELRPVESTRAEPRDLAPMFPEWKIAPAFFEPLDDDEIVSWQADAGPLQTPSRVAASRHDYGNSRKAGARKRK